MIKQSKKERILKSIKEETYCLVIGLSQPWSLSVFWSEPSDSLHWPHRLPLNGWAMEQPILCCEEVGLLPTGVR